MWINSSMDEQRLYNQLEPIYSSSVPIQDIAWKTCREQWKIKKDGKRGSGEFMLAAKHNGCVGIGHIYVCICMGMWAVPGRVNTAFLNCKNPQSLAKPPFCIQQFSSLLRLFKLTTTSPLTNYCPMQKQKTQNGDVHCFYVLFCLPSFACTSSLSVVLRDCRHEDT